MPALAAAVIAVVVLRRTARVLTVVSVLLFIASVGQWGTGHLISTMGMDGWTPFHVFFSSVVLALAIRASVRSAMLRRSTAPEAPGTSTPSALRTLEGERRTDATPRRPSAGRYRR